MKKKIPLILVIVAVIGCLLTAEYLTTFKRWGKRKTLG